MPTEDRPEEVRDREDGANERSFDEIAKGLASGAISRGRALKLVGAGILGAALSFLALPDKAESQTRFQFCPEGHSQCIQRGGNSFQITCCPAGTKCCQSVGALGVLTGPTCCRTNSLADTCGTLLVGNVCVAGCIPDVRIRGLVPVGIDSCQ